MKHKLLWVWLTVKSCMNSTKITRLWDKFETIEDIYEAKSYDDIKGIGEKEKKALLDKSLDHAEKVCGQMARLGGKILVYDDKYFPDALRNIVDPPYVLYVKGNILLWERHLMVGVVGARKCTDYGLKAVREIVTPLASKGVVIVSGMANGIDGASARAALSAGGTTIAILGSGLDIIYPKENSDLHQSILSRGLIMTEYPPGSIAYPSHFPERNRLIAGLSRGVLVIEATLESGSLITARRAHENGRDIFAVPGSIFDAHYAGTNRLINQGAKLTASAEDIISEYPYEARFLNNNTADIASVFDPVSQLETEAVHSAPPEDAETPKSSGKRAKAKEENEENQPISIEDKKYSTLNDKEKLIIKLLIEDNMHIDEIARASKLPMNELNPLIVMLEMKQMIRKMPGNNFRLNI